MVMMHGRLPWCAPHDLSDEQRSVYDAIVDGPRKANSQAPQVDEQGRLHGPFNAMVLAPKVGDLVQQLGAGVRYKTELTGRQRELAILTVARLHKSDFEWMAHEALGRAAGLSDDELSAIQRGDVPETLDGPEKAIVSTVEHLVIDKDLDDEQFALARDTFGQSTVIEIVVLVGHYELLARSMRVFGLRCPRAARSAGRNAPRLIGRRTKRLDARPAGAAIGPPGGR